MERESELFGPGELARRVGYSASGVKKLERLGVIPPAMRLVGSNRRVWRGEQLEVIRERIAQRRGELTAA